MKKNFFGSEAEFVFDVSITRQLIFLNSLAANMHFHPKKRVKMKWIFLGGTSEEHLLFLAEVHVGGEGVKINVVFCI